jgi:hypothetical protein
MKFRFFITLMMEAARTSEMSVDKYFTRQYIPEDKSEQESVIACFYLSCGTA